MESLRGRYICALDQEDVGGRRDQLARIGSHAIGITIAPARHDFDAATRRPAGLRQRLDEGSEKPVLLWFAGGCAHQHTDAPCALALLRAASSVDRRKSRI